MTVTPPPRPASKTLQADCHGGIRARQVHRPRALPGATITARRHYPPIRWPPLVSDKAQRANRIPACAEPHLMIFDDPGAKPGDESMIARGWAAGPGSSGSRRGRAAGGRAAACLGPGRRVSA